MKKVTIKKPPQTIGSPFCQKCQTGEYIYEVTNSDNPTNSFFVCYGCGSTITIELSKEEKNGNVRLDGE